MAKRARPEDGDAEDREAKRPRAEPVNVEYVSPLLPELWNVVHDIIKKDVDVRARARFRLVTKARLAHDAAFQCPWADLLRRDRAALVRGENGMLTEFVHTCALDERWNRLPFRVSRFTPNGTWQSEYHDGMRQTSLVYVPELRIYFARRAPADADRRLHVYYENGTGRLRFSAHVYGGPAGTRFDFNRGGLAWSLDEALGHLASTLYDLPPALLE